MKLALLAWSRTLDLKGAERERDFRQFTANILKQTFSSCVYVLTNVFIVCLCANKRFHRVFTRKQTFSSRVYAQTCAQKKFLLCVYVQRNVFVVSLCANKRFLRVTNLKQNEPRAFVAESTHRGGN